MADSVASLQNYVTYDEDMEMLSLYIRKQNRKVLAPEMTELECADKLQWVNASRNPGLTIPDSFDFTRLKGLKYLNLSQCGLTEFVGGLCDLPKLETLVLSNNNVRKFPDSLAPLQNLISLCLDGCNLEMVPDCISMLPALKTLILIRNKLQQIPPTFYKLAKLKVLNLAHNQFPAFPNSLCTESHRPAGSCVPKNLKSLHLSCNSLTAFPEVVFDMPLLTHLYLNGNKITSLPNCPEFRAKLEGIPCVIGLQHISKATRKSRKRNRSETLQG